MIKSSIAYLTLAVIVLANISPSEQQYWKSNSKRWASVNPQGLEKFPDPKPEKSGEKMMAAPIKEESNSKSGTQKSFAVAGGLQSFQAAAPAAAAAVVGQGPFAIQQPAIGATGEIIIENLVGGIPYNCIGRPTGHYRDNRFADIFHACVHGAQRKTYACPIVGERTYFDEVTRRCEFVNRNPNCCVNVSFYH